MIVFLLLVGVVAIVVIAGAALQDVYLPPVGDTPSKASIEVQTLEVDDNSIPSAGYVATHPPNLPDWEAKPCLFTNIQVKSIKGMEGWSSVSFKVNERQYRLDMEDAFAKELGKRLQ